MTDTVADWLNLSSRWQAQLIVSGALIVALAVLRTIVLAIVHRRIKEPSVWYRGRKLTTYIVTFVGFVMLASIWVQGSGLATYVGFLTAGLAIALSDVLKNLAGWLFIVLRRPFRVGDRVAVGEEAGDVIDVRAFRFSLQEWAPARDGAFPAYTGRIVHVPNGLLFTEPAANYSEGFKYVFHEIAVLVTFESDWRRARDIVLETVQEHAAPLEEVAAELRSTSQEYRLTIDQVVPTVFTRVGDSGVEITGRLAVPYLETRAIEDAVWTDILDGFAAEPKVELAYPTVRTYFEGPVRIQGGD
jgi:small-conductance mechanosensitive channel